MLTSVEIPVASDGGPAVTITPQQRDVLHVVRVSVSLDGATASAVGYSGATGLVPSGSSPTPGLDGALASSRTLSSRGGLTTFAVPSSCAGTHESAATSQQSVDPTPVVVPTVLVVARTTPIDHSVATLQPSSWSPPTATTTFHLPPAAADQRTDLRRDPPRLRRGSPVHCHNASARLAPQGRDPPWPRQHPRAFRPRQQSDKSINVEVNSSSDDELESFGALQPIGVFRAVTVTAGRDDAPASAACLISVTGSSPLISSLTSTSHVTTMSTAIVQRRDSVSTALAPTDFDDVLTPDVFNRRAMEPTPSMPSLTSTAPQCLCHIVTLQAASHRLGLPKLLTTAPLCRHETRGVDYLLSMPFAVRNGADTKRGAASPFPSRSQLASTLTRSPVC